MYKFTIKCNNQIIGETDLEYADPTMGMHFGKLIPSESYSKFQEAFRNAYEIQKWDDLHFEVISNKTNNQIDYNFVGIEDPLEFPNEIEFTLNVKSNEDILNN